MPGVFKEEKPEIAGAICAPPEATTNGEADELVMPQPRQPSSLQGLLRFAMEATKSDDAPSESQFAAMDEGVNKSDICLSCQNKFPILEKAISGERT